MVKELGNKFNFARLIILYNYYKVYYINQIVPRSKTEACGVYNILCLAGCILISAVVEFFNFIQPALVW